ncbi:MAG: pitrilysin family protein [Polyangiales bacterium]
MAPPAPVTAAPPPPPEAPATLSDDQVLVLRSESAQDVVIRVVFDAGSADDPAGQEGATALGARWMLEGGTAAMTYAAFTRALFPLAASVDVEVERDMTTFVGRVHRDNLARFYPLLRDALLHPRLGDDDFNRLRTQARSALTLELRGADDEALGREVLQALIYQGHPYGHPPLGTERGLDALTADGVRAHRAAVLCQGRVRVGVAGAVDDAFVETLRRDLAGLPDACAARAPLTPPARPAGLHVVVIDKPASSATAISFGHPLTVTRRDDAHAALRVATDYLGLHRQSLGVLYQTIREARGLNYGDYAYAEHFAQEGWSRFPRTNIQRRQQYASVWIRPVPAPVAHFTLRAALRATQAVVEHGVPEADLARVRTFLDGYAPLQMQTASSRLGDALDARWNGWSESSWSAHMRARWQTLDVAAVRAAAAEHLTARDLWVAVVAPNARALADAIATNAPSPITYDSPKPASVMTEDREIAAYPLPVRPDDVRVIPLDRVFRDRDWLRAE